MIFNSSVWLSVLRKSYGLDVQVIGHKLKVDNYISEVPGFESSIYIAQYTCSIPFAVKKNMGSIKYVSLPFSDYVNLIQDNGETDSIISEIIRNYPNAEIEIRNKYTNNGFASKLVGYTHSLLLNNSEEKIFNSFKKTQVQQPIQKAIRDGLKTEIRTDYESIHLFYKLHLVTRKKLGVPVQPRKFFFNFWNEIIKKEMGYVVLVRLNDKVISSGVFAGINKILTYKFSASDPKYLNYRPNNLMLWTAIREAKQRGFEIFDFGRTDLDTEGLRKFKIGWGTVEEPLYYSYYPKVPDNSNFKFIKDKIVAPIIRHSPKFVCQWSGELFYKYFG